jgi:acetoacetyl-CoA synthetase
MEARARRLGSASQVIVEGVDAPIWTPSPERIAQANLTGFRRHAAERWSLDLPDYAALHRFSIDRAADFWRTVWDFTGIRGEIGERTVERPDGMPGARYFPDARLNFTENLLRGDDSQPALVFTARIASDDR